MKRSAARAIRRANHAQAKYRAAAGKPAALLAAAWDDWRAAVRDAPADEAAAEQQHMTQMLTRRAAEVRRGK